MAKKLSFSLLIFLLAILSGCDFSDTPIRTWEHSGLGSFDAKLSQNGTLALVATVDHGTHLWDLNENQSKFIFSDKPQEKTPHQILSFRPPIATTAFKNQFVVWNTKNAQSLGFWQMPGNILSMDLTQDGRFALMGMDNNQAHLIDLKTGFTFKIFQHADNINSVAFSNNEQYVLIGSDDTAARLWDLNSGEMAHQWFHDSKITFVAMSPNNEYALISSAQHLTEIKNTKTGETISHLSFNQFPLNLVSNQSSTVTTVTFSQDGQYVFTGSPPRHIYQWRINDGKLIRKWVIPTKKSRPHAAIPLSIVLLEKESKQELIVETSNGKGYVFEF